MILRKVTAIITALLIATVFIPLQTGAETEEEYGEYGEYAEYDASGEYDASVEYEAPEENGVSGEAETSEEPEVSVEPEASEEPEVSEEPEASEEYEEPEESEAYEASEMYGGDRTDWDVIQEQYRFDDEVQNLIFVKYEGQSKATLYMYEKDEMSNWNEELCCTAYTGSNGIDKKKEGDRRTPTGDFPITNAFGIKDDPGSQIEYLKVNENHYWCADDYYNQLVDISQQSHSCRGEHLIDYTKQYAYAMNIGYNTGGIEGEGSAIFLHCFGNSNQTQGCIAVSEENMIKLLQTCKPGTRICIYDD